MKYILFIFLFLLKFAVIAQPDLGWVKSIEGTFSEDGSTRDMGAMTIDSLGNVFITGFFSGTVDFDPGEGIYNLTSSPFYDDIFILKLDASGNFAWAKNVGGNSAEWGLSIAVDDRGNVYTTGEFHSYIADFDPGPGIFNLTSNGNGDIFILKLDSVGNFVWAKNMGSDQNDEGRSITIDQSGNIYTTGNFQRTVDFDPNSGVFNLTSNNSYNYDVFILKLDSLGNFVWAKNMGGPQFEKVTSIAVDSSNNVYTTGFFRGTADFNPGSGIFDLISDSIDIFISKLDAFGNFVWAKKIGGGTADVHHSVSISVDVLGSVYTTGTFDGISDFDPGTGSFFLTSAGNEDAFILKLDISGNFLWAKIIGGSSTDLANSSVVDSYGNIYTLGNFEGIVDFDPGPDSFNLASAGTENVFILKLDAFGNFMWAENMKGPYDGEGFSIKIDGSGNIYTKGCFNGVIEPGEGNPNTMSKGEYGIFIKKLTHLTMVSINGNNNIKNFKIFPNPSSGVFTVSPYIKNTKSKICIYDVLGNCVMNEEYLNEEIVLIDLSDKVKGIYLMEIIGDKGRTTKKIVLQ